MAYDCINGWEDMIEALALSVPEDRHDEPYEVAMLAVARIEGLREQARAARAMLDALKNLMGYHTLIGGDSESNPMQLARTAIALAEKAGIKTEAA